jgi:hypothetical protein
VKTIGDEGTERWCSSKKSEKPLVDDEGKTLRSEDLLQETNWTKLYIKKRR